MTPEARLRLIAQLAGDALAALRSARVPELSIPFSLRGTLWVEVESFGKIAAGFGPYADTWQLR